VKWAVETRGVLLINEATGAVVTVEYPQAAIWDLLTRGESNRQIARKLCAIASLDPDAAEALVRETLAAWREAGFLAREEDPSG